MVHRTGCRWAVNQQLHPFIYTHTNNFSAIGTTTFFLLAISLNLIKQFNFKIFLTNL
jgi:hypothetical protein